MRTEIKPRGLSRSAIAGLAAIISTAAVFALAACAGDNLFENSGTQTLGSPPIVASITAPATAREGQRVDIRVKAIGRRGLKTIAIRFRGATDQDTTFTVEPTSTDTVTVDASLQLPDTVSDTNLRIEVTATDQFGGVSDIATRSVTITDATAPAITASVGATTASAGGNIELTIKATDALGLKQIGYAVITEKGDTLGGSPTLINASGSTRDTIFTIPLPTTLTPSQVKVLGIAVNSADLRGVSLPLAVTVVDSLKPTVQITEPNEGDSYPLRDSIAVRVHVADASGIKGVTIRGVGFRFFPDSTQNTTAIDRFPTVTIPFPQGPDRPLPKDTVIFRYLKPNSDTTSEPIYIIAQATDSTNNIGVDTVRIIPGPRVLILNPASGSSARINSDLLVRVQAIDPQVGIDSLKLFVAGVQQDSFVFKNLGATRDQVDKSVALRIGAQTGQITLRAQVFNALGVRGTSSNPPIVNITNTLITDTEPPSVQRIVISPDRIELSDSIRVRVTATDGAGSGIKQLGAVVITIPANESPSLPRDTFYLASRTYTPALGGTPDTTFAFKLGDFYSEVGAARFPLPFTIQVHAFAVDDQGNKGCSVQETMQSLPCAEIATHPGFFLAAGQTGRVYNPTAVIGTSVGLPTGAKIADAIADTVNRRVYLSNIAQNRVEVVDVKSKIRRSPILVGSEPWGLFIVPGKTDPVDTLMVANSGGTNISFVPLDTVNTTFGCGVPPCEQFSRRLLTPNDVLLGITETLVNGFLRYASGLTLDFSDRPQFIAEDSNKVILYSTKPTTAAPEGTLRYALSDPTPLDPTDQVRPEASIIISKDAITAAADQWALAHIDSVIVVSSATADDQVILYDHVPGFPNNIISYGPTYLSTAAIVAFDSIGSDAFGTRGVWNKNVLALHDTTYVTASGDLSTIAFGEGATGPTGRIFLWTAATPSNVAGLNSKGTADLLGNASERVFGISLSHNGKMGAARGAQQTYFFSNNVREEGFLRLQGVFSGGVEGGNGGVALHPHHAAVIPQTTQELRDALAFIATGNKTLKIVDTFHFFEMGEVPIRDNIVGQVRVAAPFPGMNDAVGNDFARCDFIVAEVYGVTSTNNLVIVDIRTRDLLKGPSLTTCTQ